MAEQKQGQRKYEKTYEERRFIEMKYSYGDYSYGESVVALMQEGWSQSMAEKLVNKWKQEYSK